MKTINIFYSYSYEDQELVTDLEKQLQLFEMRGQTTVQYAHTLEEEKSARKVNSLLDIADIILLFISANYISSDYCYKELEYAWKRHEDGKSHIIPIILRPVDWRDSPIGNLYALPKYGAFVTSLPNREAALLDVAKAIRRAIKEMLGQSL
jgi:hypothetical protein